MAGASDSPEELHIHHPQRRKGSAHKNCLTRTHVGQQTSLAHRAPRHIRRSPGPARPACAHPQSCSGSSCGMTHGGNFAAWAGMGCSDAVEQVATTQTQGRAAFQKGGTEPRLNKPVAHKHPAHRVSDLAPSSSRPQTSRLPVRVKALFMAPCTWGAGRQRAAVFGFRHTHLAGARKLLFKSCFNVWQPPAVGLTNAHGHSHAAAQLEICLHCVQPHRAGVLARHLVTVVGPQHAEAAVHLAATSRERAQCLNDNTSWQRCNMLCGEQHALTSALHKFQKQQAAGSATRSDVQQGCRPPLLQPSSTPLGRSGAGWSPRA